jgi:hypothetical protein
MTRFAGALALLLTVAATAQAEQLTLEFQGTITSVVDGNAPGAPAVEFAPIPVGSAFTGIYTYDVDSPLTGGGTGYTRYDDLLSSGGLVTVNGHQFGSQEPGDAGVVSKESGFGHSGMSIASQPMSVPAGWSVPSSPTPYFTTRFYDATPQTRSLALPSSGDEIATGNMALILDFQAGVTVGSTVYSHRVLFTGKITAVRFPGEIPPPQEVAVDVAPSSDSNVVNLKSKKPKPLYVAVFGAADFDALAVVPETIELGDPLLTDPEFGTGQKVAPTSTEIADVDADGAPDLLLTFDLLQLQAFGAIDSSSTSLAFQALLDNQAFVFGSDAMSISGGGNKGKGKK